MLRFIEETIRKKAIAFSGVAEKQIRQNPVHKANRVLWLPRTEGKRKEETLLREGPR